MASSMVPRVTSLYTVTGFVCPMRWARSVALGTALAGRAGYLATFDRRHLLPLDPFKGVRVLTPGDVLRELRGLL